MLIAFCNVFLKSMQCLDLDISDFIIKIFYFFHNQNLRCKNFEKIQSVLNLSKHTFIKHISTRWLTISPATKRIQVEQLSALNEYFLKYIPSKEYVDIFQLFQTKLS